jgi:hypothetical protein
MKILNHQTMLILNKMVYILDILPSEEKGCRFQSTSILIIYQPDNGTGHSFMAQNYKYSHQATA